MIVTCGIINPLPQGVLIMDTAGLIQMWGKATFIVFTSETKNTPISRSSNAATVSHHWCDSTEMHSEAGAAEERWRKSEEEEETVSSQGNRWWRILVPVLFMEFRTVKVWQEDALCIVYTCVFQVACLMWQMRWAWSGYLSVFMTV